MRRILLMVLICAGLHLPSDLFAQSGCTSIRSCNYDPLATTDDGSCYGYNDFDCNFQIDVLDYLIFMQHYACPVMNGSDPTPAIRCDIDENGAVGVSDLLILIAGLGLTYNPN